jgi:hypothetical protein
MMVLRLVQGPSTDTTSARTPRGSTLDKFLSAVPDAAVQAVPPWET